MIYLGVDPGLRTGACWIMATKSSVTLAAHYDISGGAEGFINWWGTQHMDYDAGDITIIFESFTLREGKQGVNITPRDVIGALKALAHAQGILTVERAPAGRKRQMPDAAMRKLGMYLPGEANRNAREAIRHVLAYLKTQKHSQVLAAFQA